MTNDIWDKRFLEMAKNVAMWSKDPSRKIGAIIVDPVKKNILSTGFNGFPRGIADTEERLNDRPTKYKFVVHAEANAIFNALYNGVSVVDSHIYVYGLPVCSECAKGLIQSGVKRISCMIDERVPANWESSWKNTCDMFDEVGIKYELIDNSRDVLVLD